MDPGRHKQKVAKRNRPSFVCTNCRRRKIKCDKQTPCHNCAKMNCSDTCQYSVPSLQHLFQKPYRANICSDGSGNINNSKTIQRKERNTTLETEMDSLKSQITSLEQLLNGVEKAGFQPDCILDTQLDALKVFRIMKKPSRTTLYGPLATFSLLFSMIDSDSARIFSSFLVKERIAWKKRHGKARYLPSLVNAVPNMEEMITLIEVKLTPHCGAILERLEYFRDQLNNLLYNGYVDMNHVLECFKQLFELQNNGCYVFIRPQKVYTYCELSLILALVDIVSVFSLHENSIMFHYLLDKPTKDAITSLSTQALAASKYLRKQSYSALMSLLILRDIDYLYSSYGIDSIDESKSAFLFNTAMSYAFQLGIHREQSSRNEYVFKKDLPGGFGYKALDGSIYHIPSHNSRELWSYLRLLDASYSLNVGTPLMINDTFSDSSVTSAIGSPTTTERLTTLEREAATLMNSLSSISLHDIIQLREKFLSLNASLGTFKELIAPSEKYVSYSDIVYTAKIVSIKLKLFRSIIMLSAYLKNMMPVTGIYPSHKLTTKNVKLLRQRAKLYEIETIKGTLVIWTLIKHLCDAEETTFGRQNQNLKYLIYLKHDLLNLLFPEVFTSVVSLTNILSGTVNTTYHGKMRAEYFTKEVDDCEVIKLENINYQEIERSMTNQINDHELGNDEDEHLKLMFNNPEQLISFFCEIHRCITKYPALSENYGYFCLLKILSMFSCVADSIIKLNKSNTSSNDLNFSDILKQTKTKIETTMKLGFVDLGFDLENGSDSIENWLSSVFDEDGLLKFFHDDRVGKVGAELAIQGTDLCLDGSSNTNINTSNPLFEFNPSTRVTGPNLSGETPPLNTTSISGGSDPGSNKNDRNLTPNGADTMFHAEFISKTGGKENGNGPAGTSLASEPYQILF